MQMFVSSPYLSIPVFRCCETKVSLNVPVGTNSATVADNTALGSCARVSSGPGKTNLQVQGSQLGIRAQGLERERKRWNVECRIEASLSFAVFCFLPLNQKPSKLVNCLPLSSKRRAIRHCVRAVAVRSLSKPWDVAAGTRISWCTRLTGTASRQIFVGGYKLRCPVPARPSSGLQGCRVCAVPC